MQKIHTHYDNLKVSRSAPPEVIRAAYKTLAQKFHPDRNSENADASRIMSIINSSYEILSDPVKRSEYDAALKQLEAAQSVRNNSAKPTNQQTFPDQAVAKQLSNTRRFLIHVVSWWQLYLLSVGGLWLWYESEHPKPPPAGPKPYSQTYQSPVEVAQTPKYVRPELEPNGQKWPRTANYVAGYKRLHTDGLSSVTVDNTQNDSEVFVKLVSIDSANAYPIRQFYVPARSQFTVTNIRAGSYDMRHRDLNNGGLTRSEPFELQQIESEAGTQYSTLTMTLFKVKNGNMQSFSLSEGEF